MSRHNLDAIDANRYALIVGWDNPLCTFFAQVWDLSKDEDDHDDDERCVFWVGDESGSVPSVEALSSAIADYAVVPVELREQLERDRTESQPLTRLQRSMLERVKRVERMVSG